MSENFDSVSADHRPSRRHGRDSLELAKVWRRIVGVLETVVRWLGNAIAALLAIHVVLTVGNANPDNGITRFVAGWSEPLSLGFDDLFQPADPRLAVLINYSCAAVFWLIITAVAVRILRGISS